MAFERNRVILNPNHRKMTVADMSNPLSKANQKVLLLLEKMENEGCKFKKNKCLKYMKIFK